MTESISASEYLALVAKGKQGGRQVSKYKNEFVEADDGEKFRSKKEAGYIGKLQILERAGKITDLETQVKYFFEGLKYDSGRTVQYWADARYTDLRGNVHVVDVKGIRTPLYKLKKALMRKWYGIEVEEV